MISNGFHIYGCVLNDLTTRWSRIIDELNTIVEHGRSILIDEHVNAAFVEWDSTSSVGSKSDRLVRRAFGMSNEIELIVSFVAHFFVGWKFYK